MSIIDRILQMGPDERFGIYYAECPDCQQGWKEVEQWNRDVSDRAVSFHWSVCACPVHAARMRASIWPYHVERYRVAAQNGQAGFAQILEWIDTEASLPAIEVVA